MPQQVRALVIMGVSGSGKSTIAAAIRDRTGAALIEGDDFHSPQNVRKMRDGTPLDDSDRQGWLEHIAQAAHRQLATTARVIIACSALKRRYRDTLRRAIPDLGFVFLALTIDEARSRVGRRSGHFMPTSLVESQFRDLEPPREEPLVLTVHATGSVAESADAVIAWWSSPPPA